MHAAVQLTVLIKNIISQYYLIRLGLFFLSVQAYSHRTFDASPTSFSLFFLSLLFPTRNSCWPSLFSFKPFKLFFLFCPLFFIFICSILIYLSNFILFSIVSSFNFLSIRFRPHSFDFFLFKIVFLTCFLFQFHLFIFFSFHS